MSMPLTVALIVIMATSSFIPFGPYLQLSQAILYENGTCTNENLTNSSNRVINTNGSVEDFLKSLPSDNTILAELVCQNTK